MAIYSVHFQVISRKDGRDAVKAAAYRSGEVLYNEKLGKTEFYAREVKPVNFILAPSNAKEWVFDREKLWNTVEEVEKRIDSQLAREVRVALPIELSDEENIELAKSYCEKMFVERGMVVDLALHFDDRNNPHFHAMLTMRELEGESFGKKQRDWNSKALMEEWREQWATYANVALEQAGIDERISHLSNEDRGLETLPTIHLGHEASALEKKGVRTELGELNRQIQEYNAEVLALMAEQSQQLVEVDNPVVIVEAETPVNEWAGFTPVEKSAVKQAAQLMGTRIDLDAVNKRITSLKYWEQKINKTVAEWQEKLKGYQRAEKVVQLIDQIKEKARPTSDDLANVVRFEKELIALGFQGRAEFMESKPEFEKLYSRVMKQQDEQRAKLETEREVLLLAKEAFENAFVRQFAAKYPDWDAAADLDYTIAKKWDEINEKNGRLVTPEEFEVMRKQIAEELREAVSRGYDREPNESKEYKAYSSLDRNLIILETMVDGVQTAEARRGKRLLARRPKKQQKGNEKGR